ncbi:hypothetical protein AXG93_59s1140 [Marchantia polymorpha subsp. ruderalis]|uniref:Uncharacterized protein n=1 Tax=Marchantia polymorpha subsp. ruderalis TaxID=1480154 RepID=A0A176W2L1_MARPO|nr:hypothetical protein AXG93_59s1140 [Marchantia polymorpha subsp. ruderalis]
MGKGKGKGRNTKGDEGRRSRSGVSESSTVCMKSQGRRLVTRERYLYLVAVGWKIQDELQQNKHEHTFCASVLILSLRAQGAIRTGPRASGAGCRARLCWLRHVLVPRTLSEEEPDPDATSGRGSGRMSSSIVGKRRSRYARVRPVAGGRCGSWPVGAAGGAIAAVEASPDGEMPVSRFLFGLAFVRQGRKGLIAFPSLRPLLHSVSSRRLRRKKNEASSLLLLCLVSFLLDLSPLSPLSPLPIPLSVSRRGGRQSCS